MNEVYTGKRSSTRRKKNHFVRNVGKLFLKQLSAALVCMALVWGMKTLPVTRLNEYSSALGRAIRHETDIKMFAELYENIKDVLNIDGMSAEDSTDREY